MKKIIYVAVFLLSIGLVTAAQYCFPVEEQCGAISEWSRECRINPNFFKSFNLVYDLMNHELPLDCDTVLTHEYGCEYKPSKFLCKDAFTGGDFLEGFWYCNIDSVVYCDKGCDIINNKCIGNNDPGYGSQCNENYMQCGNGLNYDPSGDLYKCVNGYWSLIEYCDEGCTENSVTFASCSSKMYYCKDAVNRCYASSIDLDNCYDTIEKCESKSKYCCIDGEGKGRIRDSCMPDERTFVSTDPIAECPTMHMNWFESGIFNILSFWESISEYITWIGIIGILSYVFLYLFKRMRSMAQLWFILAIFVIAFFIYIQYYVKAELSSLWNFIKFW